MNRIKSGYKSIAAAAAAKSAGKSASATPDVDGAQERIDLIAQSCTAGTADEKEESEGETGNSNYIERNRAMGPGGDC